VGLSYAFEDSAAASNPLLAAGPSGEVGTVLADKRRLAGQALGYYPSQQTWRQIPQSELWVGYYENAQPTPEDLARRKLIPGDLVELADGQQWQIPRVRRRIIHSALPARMDLDESGSWVYGGLAAAERELFELVTPWVDLILSAAQQQTDQQSSETASVELSLADELDKVVRLVAANYVVSRIELAMLAALSEAVLDGIILAAIDYQAVRDLAKKNESAAAK